MKTAILNSHFQHPADGWYQIEAKGRHPNRAAGVVQVIDDAAAEAIVRRFNTEAAAGRLRHGQELLVDHEHFCEQPNQETRAYGWLQELRHRPDGIYGRIRWTATGRPAVDGGDYRFFSTEYDVRDLEPVAGLANESGRSAVRPLRLAGLTLTNMNNNRGQRPITNKEISADASAPVVRPPNSIPPKYMNRIASLLGLPAEAGEETVLAEVARLQNRGDISTADLHALRQRHQELAEENQQLLTDQCEALLDAHGLGSGERLRARLKPVLLALKNREERAAALADFGLAPARAGAAAAPRKLFNRDTTPPAATGAIGETGSARHARQAEVCVQEYRLRNRCTYDEARQAVRRSHPELFRLTTST